VCGIAGIIGAGQDPVQIERMVAIQHHRGPDATGVWRSGDGSISLGHNRLSIIDLSAAGIQPMWDAQRRRLIVFNGEIYNYRDLRQELRDYQFRSNTDTEVIPAAYARCVDNFISVLAFAIDAGGGHTTGPSFGLADFRDVGRDSGANIPGGRKSGTGCLYTMSREASSPRSFTGARVCRTTPDQAKAGTCAAGTGLTEVLSE